MDGTMILRPINDRVVVERIPDDAKTPGGLLYVPENAKRETFRAKVLAVGPGAILDNGIHKPMVVKAGDIVLVGRHFSGEYELSGRRLMVFSEAEVLGVVEPG